MLARTGSVSLVDAVTVEEWSRLPVIRPLPPADREHSGTDGKRDPYSAVVFGNQRKGAGRAKLSEGGDQLQTTMCFCR